MSAVSLGLPGLRSQPGSDGLVDQYGRMATDLRLSLIDRCNLRCAYCMPAEGLAWIPKPQLLTADEVIRLAGIAVDLGVTGIRLTGGEPLLRRDLVTIVAALAQLRTVVDHPLDLAMTTNGIGLERLAAPLKQAGLRRLNVSLDTLQRDRFITLAKRDRLSQVLQGLDAAAEAGFSPIKVNAVLIRGINDDEAPDLLRYCLTRGYQLRFIEQMPLDPQGAWSRDGMVTAEEMFAALSDFALTPLPGRGSAPAEAFSVAEGPDHPAGTVGIVASVTRPFCGDCNRTRLTADGMVRNCLFARTETDLREPLRAGATDAELASLWQAAMWGKAPGHGIDDPSFLQPDRPMSAIGG